MDDISGEFEELNATNITVGMFTLMGTEGFECGVVTDAKNGRRYFSIKLEADEVNLEQVITFTSEATEYIKDFLRRKGL